MAEENPTNPTPPASNIPVNDPGNSNPTPPTNPTPSPGTDNDPVVLAKKVGELEGVGKEYQTYRTQVDPILETLALEPELLGKLTEAHKKRLGLSTDTPEDNKNNPITPPAADTDTRNAVVNQISTSFEEKVGINKLEPEKQREMRGMLGQMIKQMVDPKDNKTITQVFEEISLQKLPWYFEKAYDLLTKDDQNKRLVEETRNQVENEYRGVMGGMPSTSISTDNVTLSPEERIVCQKQGISEEDYLKNKKEIIALRG